MERDADQNERQHKKNVEYLTILKARGAVSSLLSQRVEDILDAVRPGYILERRVFKSFADVKLLGELKGNKREIALRNYDLLAYIANIGGISDYLRRGGEIPLLSTVTTKVGQQIQKVRLALAAEYLGSEEVGLAICAYRSRKLGFIREKVEKEMVPRDWLESYFDQENIAAQKLSAGSVLVKNLANASCESLIKEVRNNINKLKLPREK